MAAGPGAWAWALAWWALLLLATLAPIGQAHGSGAAAERGLAVPLARRPGPVRRRETFGSHAGRRGLGLSARWLNASVEASVEARWITASVELLSPGKTWLSASVEEPLDDFFNMQYMLEIGLGTPSQNLQVLVDTGSSDLWVHPRSFDAQRSSTLRTLGSRVQIVYGQGSVAGGLVRDDMRLGELDIGKVTFLLPDQEKGMGNVVADGVLGMAFEGLSHTGTTLLQHLQQANVSSFSLFLTGQSSGSYLVLGPPDETWFDAEQRVWIPVVGNMWWAFQGTVGVEGQVLAEGTFLLDSGTSFLGAPPPLYQILVEHFMPSSARNSCELQQQTKMVLCPCEVVRVSKAVEVGAGSTVFVVQPSELFGAMEDEYGNVQCVLQVMELKPGMPFILGDTFLRTVAATFEPHGPDGSPRIGLAPLRGPRVLPTPPSPLPLGGKSTQGIWLYLGIAAALVALVWLAAGFLCRRGRRAAAARVEGSALPYCRL